MRVRLFYSFEQLAADDPEDGQFIRARLPPGDAPDRDWDFIISTDSSTGLYEWGDENLYKRSRLESDKRYGIVYTIVDDEELAMLILKFL
jgi:hypothetical protein